MTAWGWLGRVATMLWMETTANRWNFILRSVLFVSVSGLVLFVAYVAADLMKNDQLVADALQKRAERSQVMTTSLSGEAKDVPERVAQAAQTAEKLLSAKGSLEVFTNDPSLWPTEVLRHVERWFGPIQTMDEATYHQRNGPASVWIGVSGPPNSLRWRVIQKAPLWGIAFGKYRPAYDSYVLVQYITSVGKAHQDQYLSEVAQTPEFQKLPHWTAPELHQLTTKTDLKALALFGVLALFVLPTLFAATQGLTWDFNRQKNVFEPYATMRIPVWGVLLKESLGSSFWYFIVWTMATALLAGLLIDQSWPYLAFLLGVVALGGAGCWLNLQINMFWVVTFQTVWGRRLGRLLIMPFFFLPYHLFRVLGVKEILEILDGKTLHDYNVWWLWGMAGGCVFAGAAILLGSAWRVGRYRKGFAPT